MPLKDQKKTPISEAYGSIHKSKNRLGNVWLHDIAERFKIRRKTIANKDGLDEDYDVGTYPQESAEITYKGGGIIKGALLATTLLAGGAYLYDWIANRAAEKAPEVIEKVRTDVYDYKAEMKVVPED